MTFRKLNILSRRRLRRSRLLQVLALCLFWLLGQGLVVGSGLPLSGGVVGILLVLALLYARLLRPHSLQRGADWFLAEMLLFFIPAVPAVLNHPEFAGWLGLKVLAIILLGTVLVMLCGALIVDASLRWVEKKPEEPHA